MFQLKHNTIQVWLHHHILDPFALLIPKILITYNKANLTECVTVLTLKHRETHGCVVSTVATDALVLKHQTISIHNAD